MSTDNIRFFINFISPSAHLENKRGKGRSDVRDIYQPDQDNIPNPEACDHACRYGNEN